MPTPVTGRHHTAVTLHPDVQNSTARHESHGTMSFYKRATGACAGISCSDESAKKWHLSNRMNGFIPVGQPQKNQPNRML